MILHLFHQQNFWLNEIWFFHSIHSISALWFPDCDFFQCKVKKLLLFIGTWFCFRDWTRNLCNLPGQRRQHQEKETQVKGRGWCPLLQPMSAPGSRCGAPGYHSAVDVQTATSMEPEFTCFVNLETCSSTSSNCFSVDFSGFSSETKFIHALISIWKVHFAVFSQPRHQVSGKNNFKRKYEQIKIPSKKRNRQKLLKYYKTKEERFENPIS